MSGIRRLRIGLHTAMVLVPHQNTVRFPYISSLKLILIRSSTAEFRGPGVRHNFEDSGDDYDLDLDQHQRTRGAGGRSGRIILLGDGTEVLTDSEEHEIFDHEEEDKDLASQVSKGQTTSNDENRGEREETPGPESHVSNEKHQIPEPTQRSSFESPSSISSDKPKSADTGAATSKPIPESALPDKLPTPLTPQEKS